jgi:V/A-type H+-transporting ATPase subunit I
MWGTPGRAEVDPTGLLPIVVPLLFGYMFPDVGQGLVLTFLAAALFRRFPALRFLLFCGASSVLFGFLFGEFFGLEGWIEPIWLRPLDHPLQVLLIPLMFGAALMLLGLLFSGIEAYWRGQLAPWLLADAAVLVLYASALVAIVHRPVAPLIGVALAWYVLGAWLLCRRGLLPNVGVALGRLLHSVFDLVLNTVSFLRVGAFALAHAGLSSAVVQLAEAADSIVVFLAVLAVGNVISMALEGLVVFVQTTRLVLFEFFIRFLKADGRLFRPLHRPRPGSGGRSVPPSPGGV